MQRGRLERWWYAATALVVFVGVIVQLFVAITGRPPRLFAERRPENVREKSSDVVVGRLAERSGLFCPKGPAGTVLIFGDSLVHGSPPNMSPWDRRIPLILNPVANRQTTFGPGDHQHHCSFEPVRSLEGPFWPVPQVRSPGGA